MIQVDLRDARPIYEQVKDGYKRLILKSVLKKDDKMPSVRSVATSLTINPNTIQRAYRELEQEGLIYSVAGKGSFVAEIPEISDAQKNELFKSFDAVVEKMSLAGIKKNELISRLDKAYKTKGGKGS